MTAIHKLNAIGIEAICCRIENGESNAEIAESLGVDKGDMSRWINSDSQRSARVQASRIESAEAWLDKGLRAIETCNDDTKGGAAKAKAYAQECARRAAIRNPAYRESRNVDVGVNVSIQVLQQRLQDGRKQLSRVIAAEPISVDKSDDVVDNSVK